MDFFQRWGRNLENVSYMRSFLAGNQEAQEIVENGTPEQIAGMCRVLQGIALERFIDCIGRLHPNSSFTKGDVPMFSDFLMGVVRVPELLEFAPEGLDFDTLGYELKGCKGMLAKKKYGENHAKLAETLGVAVISDYKPRVVTLTALGRYFIPLPLNEKADVLKKMALRNPYLQCLIAEAAKGPVKYRETVGCLSDSTAVRRRSNVHYLMDFILKRSRREALLSHIDWTV